MSKEIYSITYNRPTTKFIIHYKLTDEEYKDLPSKIKFALKQSGYNLETTFYADYNHDIVKNSNPRMYKAITDFKIKKKLKEFIDE